MTMTHSHMTLTQSHMTPRTEDTVKTLTETPTPERDSFMTEQIQQRHTVTTLTTEAQS